ncbi:inhibitor of the pro-sigma K processing machinery [Keratinibaculum paraultunense]|uniref:Inhibitor of the pro-sigma K processing machinery n=1 Tax=Keratinibaculum paraultunense TaxID=1278232 RepID=A0A4R3KUF9_9FIRM|nr:pro-sigmaK processing inhibitor BofA family protein [Keratinibaculum paraultunense]QQY79863.1 pro-sigmaK processing inhibitor BofA family protein [Keratinibaculum paraultunense]TCS88748.1 inhibitor of the pro-sigma K processing machinery [Keratinibaculum paraultunense]
MGISTFLAFIFGLFLLYVIGMILVIPIKIIWKLIINGVIGGILLLLFNLIGKGLGLFIAINPITALIAGFLGIPGVILLLILQKFL